MEGISDAQRYRQLPVNTDAAKKEEQEKDKKVSEIDDRKPRQENQEQGKTFRQEEGQTGQKGLGETEQGTRAEAGDNKLKTTAGDGTVYIQKGGTRITDANAVVAIAEICAKANQTDIKADKMSEQLKAKGIDCYETTLNGKPAIKFGNGDVFVDSSGNNALGLEDGDFSKALKQIESKYGTDLSALTSKVDEIVKKRFAKGDDANGDLALQGAGMINPMGGFGAVNGYGADNPAAAGNGQDLESIFGDLDQKLEYQGYQGPQAKDLYESDRLEDTLKNYHIDMPEIAEKGSDLSNAHDFARDVFNCAHCISRLKSQTQMA